MSWSQVKFKFVLEANVNKDKQQQFYKKFLGANSVAMSNYFRNHVASSMAFWLTSFPDGSRRKSTSENEHRSRHELPLVDWFVDKLTHEAGDRVCTACLRGLGSFTLREGGHKSIHGLIRVQRDENSQHYAGWSTLWNDEALLQFEYYQCPADAYTFTVCDARCCVQDEPIHQVFVRKQKKLVQDSSLLSLRCVEVKPSPPLHC